MSGTVNAISNLVDAAPGLTNVLPGVSSAVLSQLDGLLQTAAFRGVTFDMIDVREVAGRRVVDFLFPQIDTVDNQDMGAFQGDMTITGIIGGDDYVVRAERMRAAFLTKGPATLLHPWLGELQVLLRPPGGEIHYALNELGVARLQFVVRRYDPPSTGATDTLGALLTKADALIDSGELMIEQTFSAFALPLTLVASLSSFLTQAAGAWSGLFAVGNGSATATDQITAAGITPFAISGDFETVCQPSLTALSAGIEPPTSNPDTTFADQVAALLFATPLAIAVAAQTTNTPAIGSAAGADLTTASVLDPTEAVTVLLAGATTIAALGTVPAASVSGSGLAPLAIATASSILAQAISVGVSLPFVSQQDAMTMRAKLDAALAALANQAVAIGSTQPIAVNSVLQSISALRSAVAADFNALIGRLPAVKTITTNKTMSVWLIALYLVGDTPAKMQATINDIVTRNDVVNPGAVPAGALQVLI